MREKLAVADNWERLAPREGSLYSTWTMRAACAPDDMAAAASSFVLGRGNLPGMSKTMNPLSKRLLCSPSEAGSGAGRSVPPEVSRTERRSVCAREGSGCKKGQHEKCRYEWPSAPGGTAVNNRHTASWNPYRQKGPEDADA